MDIPPASARISAVVPVAIRRSLDLFMKTAGLPSRSAAVAEALTQWAEDFERESRVAEASARYGSAYAADAKLEERRATANLRLIPRRRRKA